jgi:hypothetical protein
MSSSAKLISVDFSKSRRKKSYFCWLEWADENYNNFHRLEYGPMEVLTIEFIWPSKAKSLTCDLLKLIHKNQQDDIKYTLDVAKCDKIFDELHKGGCIKISHTLPPLEELKR